MIPVTKHHSSDVDEIVRCHYLVGGWWIIPYIIECLKPPTSYDSWRSMEAFVVSQTLAFRGMCLTVVTTPQLGPAITHMSHQPPHSN